MVNSKFEKHYFEFESGYPSSILKGKKPLHYRFWVRYMKRHKGGKRLLDIGCGKGFFLQYAEKFYETYGVDVSEYGIKEARNRLHKTKLCIGDANQLDFESHYFDIVTCFDVLEHINDPEACIKECNRVLTQNGLIVVCVPNIESLGHRWKKQQWFGYRDPTHVSLLSNEEWEQLLQKNNFKIVDKFYEGLWDSPYFSRMPTFIQHPPFKFLFTVLFPMLGIMGVKLPKRLGENLIIVANKTLAKE